MEIEQGEVKIKHHSTSSQIEMTVTSDEPTETGGTEKVTDTIWFDYGQWEDVKRIIETYND